METERRIDHGFDPSDAKPADDAPSVDERAPDRDTDQDPVEDPDARREPGPGKS